MTTITGVIARTGLRLLREEHYLAAHLAGYADYRRRVRWRLIPHVS